MPAEQRVVRAGPTAGTCRRLAASPWCSTIEDVGGTQWLDTTYAGRVKVPEENAAAALEVMSRFAVDPRWLVYLPPTMSPAPRLDRRGVPGAPGAGVRASTPRPASTAWCARRSTWARARSPWSPATRRPPRAASGSRARAAGVVYTRTGRAFFEGELGATWSTGCVGRARRCSTALETDWLVLDCELLPWSAKAMGLIKEQYASVGAAARVALPAVSSVLAAAAGRGLDVADLTARAARRTEDAAAFRDAYAAYCRPTDGLDGVTLAPFQVLAVRGACPGDRGGTPLAPRPARLARPPAAHAHPARRRRPRRSRRAPGGRRLVARAHRMPAARAWSSSRPTQPKAARAAGAQGARPGVPPDHLRARLHRLARPPARPPPGQEAVPRPARARSRPGGPHPLRRAASRCGACTRRSSPCSPWSPSRWIRGSDGRNVVGS